MSAATGVNARARPISTRSSVHSTLSVQAVWFGGGLALSFMVPYIFTSALDLQHDLYYLIYATVVCAFLAAYVGFTKLDVVAMFSRAWKWSLAIGALSAAFVVFNVLSRDSTDGPSGFYAAFEFTWRGLAYGAVDALLLTAFPGAVAFRILRQRIDGPGRKILYGALAAVLVVAITAVYHLGYEQFRDDGVAGPEIGSIAISMPMLLTANPVGSVMAHASMHATADLHAYETDLFLPPQTDAP